MIKSSRTTTTKVSAVFLATVLIAGTIALSFPSFMIGSAQAQSDYGMDNRYNSYGSSDYGNDNSYGSSYYERDNSYGSDYGRDNDRKSYGNDYGYESQYHPSYKPDYKPQYSSYDKKDDNRDKSKDNKSVDIKKIKCNNININFNAAGGTGNGNNGNTTNGNDNNGNKTDGFKKIERDGFTFICINNNNNVAGGTGGGNVTDGADEEEGCEECFDQLTGRVAEALANGLANGFDIDGLNVPAGTSIEELCVLLEGANISLTASELLTLINQVLPNATDAEITQILQLVFCLEDLGLIDLELSLIPPV
jgi:hypothetical protein